MQATIDESISARKTHAGFRVAVLVEIVAQSEYRRTVVHRRAVVAVKRLRQLDLRIVGVRVVDREILFETLHHQRQTTVLVDDSRRSVVDDFARTADMVDEYDVFGLDECEIVHRLVARRELPLAVAARVDAYERIDVAVDLFEEAEIVADDYRNALTGDFDALDAVAAAEESHFAAGGDVAFGYAAHDLALFDDCGCAARAVLRQNRKSDYRGDRIAVRGYLGEGVVAQFEECGLAQQVECRRSADRLFRKDYGIHLFAFGALHGTDDFRGVAADVADSIVELCESDFHLLFLRICVKRNIREERVRHRHKRSLR